MRFLTIIRNSSSDSCSSLHQPTIVLVHVGIFQSLCEDGSNVGISIICFSIKNFIPSRNSESTISSLDHQPPFCFTHIGTLGISGGNPFLASNRAIAACA